MASFLHSFLFTFFVSFVACAVSSNTTIGTFGPLIPYQPFNDWLYPSNQSIPIEISLGNGSLAFSFGFQLTYGVSLTSDPSTYIAMDSIVVDQYTQFFNFTGNLLSNKFWWNTTTPSLPDGSYLLTTSASFFSCSDGPDLERTDIFWSNRFSVGEGGTIPANSTGNSMLVGNSSDITAGMYDCTALKDAKRQVSLGLVGTYGAGILFTAITMTFVKGKNPTS